MAERWRIDKSRPWDSAARVELRKKWLGLKKDKALVVHESFLRYLKQSQLDEDEEREVLASLVSQRLEAFEMQNSKNHPFHGDAAGFEHFCRVKYKKLYDHINRMIDQLIDSRI